MFGVGVGAGNSLPVRKLMVAVLLAAAATFLGVFAVAQAQAADGTMTGVTLTSGSPGTLVVSWNTPSPAPTDYRLRWAPVGSDYLSWKDDNETDRSNAYPAGDATSLTLSGISEGTEFKVQARARYHKGEHKNSPWSGPWAEVQAQVMSQLSKDSSAAGTRNSETPNSSAPAAPNLVGIAVTPAGQVLLSWLNPSDDSITGYQVLRGLGADSLVVIEEDTGSSGTSYTDTAPPAGQTHTYAVKARNAAGLSPLSNTATATVPAAEEEEELITASHTAAGNTLVSNLGQTALATSINVGTSFGSRFESAMSFTTGANTLGYHVTSVALPLRDTDPNNFPNPLVSIRDNNGGIPGDTVLYRFFTSSTITDDTNFQQITFTTNNNTEPLLPNTTYWIHVTTSGANSVEFQLTASQAEDTESQADWQIGNTGYDRRNAEAWGPGEANQILRLEIRGHEGPPSSRTSGKRMRRQGMCLGAARQQRLLSPVRASPASATGSRASGSLQLRRAILGIP